VRWFQLRSPVSSRRQPADTSQRTPGSQRHDHHPAADPRYDDVINLERYPIHDRASSKYQALVQGGLRWPHC